jgi:hypothetical protein
MLLDRLKIKNQIQIYSFIGNEKIKFSNLTFAKNQTSLIIRNTDFNKSTFSDLDLSDIGSVILKSTSFKNRCF